KSVAYVQRATGARKRGHRKAPAIEVEGSAIDHVGAIRNKGGGVPRAQGAVLDRGHAGIAVCARQSQRAFAKFSEAAGALQVCGDAYVVAIAVDESAFTFEEHIAGREIAQKIGFVANGAQDAAIESEG